MMLSSVTAPATTVASALLAAAGSSANNDEATRGDNTTHSLDNNNTNNRNHWRVGSASNNNSNNSNRNRNQNQKKKNHNNNNKNQQQLYQHQDPSPSTTANSTTSSSTTGTTPACYCEICYQELTYRTISPCDHNMICPECHLRIRYLHKDFKCPICKNENQQIIVALPSVAELQQQQLPQQTTDPTTTASTTLSSAASAVASSTVVILSFQDYNIWGNELGSNFIYRQDVGMFIPKVYDQQFIQPLLGYHCTIPNCTYQGITSSNTTALASPLSSSPSPPTATMASANSASATTTTTTLSSSVPSSKPPAALRALQEHLRHQHHLVLCQLCIDHIRDFVSKLPRWTKMQLQKHLQYGDGQQSGFNGHPLCEFCKPKRFYDLTALYVHLNQIHEKCFVCEKAGLPNQFFNNYTMLQRHFDMKHFLCHNVQCLEAKFVVFDNHLDLMHHERMVHGAISSSSTATGSSTKIQLEFRVRRSTDAQQQSRQNQSIPNDNDFQYGVDGNAFVPPALPVSSASSSSPYHHRFAGNHYNNSNNNSSDNTNDPNSDGGTMPLLHPLHIQRTELLRQQAAELRNRDIHHQPMEAFPTLSEAAALVQYDGTSDTLQQQQQQQGVGPLRIGWASNETAQRVGRPKAVGTVTEQDFPSLSGGTNAAATQSKTNILKLSPLNAASSKLKANASTTTASTSNIPGTSRQLSAIVQASNAISSNVSSHDATTSTTTTTNWSAKVSVPSATASGIVTPSPSPIPSVNIVNSSANLSAENFPSLPAGKPNLISKIKNNTSTTTQQRYLAAEALAHRTNPQSQSTRNTLSSSSSPPAWNSEVDFPTVGQGSSATTMRSYPAQQVRPVAALPTKQHQQVQQKQAVSIDDVKTIMGTDRYKKLKGYTKEFVSGTMEPDAYVDHAATLFDMGYADPHFWRLLPSLIASCPNILACTQATSYMENLHRMRNGALNAEWMTSQTTMSAAVPPVTTPVVNNATSSSWRSGPFISPDPPSVQGSSVGNGSGNSAMVGWSTPLSAQRPVMSSAMIRASTAGTSYPVMNNNNKASSNKKNAWGTNGVDTAIRVKAPPGSLAVVAAAAASTPSMGTATRFMAKEQKLAKQQQQQQQQQSSSSSAIGTGQANKKKKQKDELRQLAFGA